MLKPKIGGYLYAVRNDSQEASAADAAVLFIGVTQARVVNWDEEVIVCDRGGPGFDEGSVLIFRSWSGWYATEAEATQAAMNLADQLERQGKVVKRATGLIEAQKRGNPVTFPALLVPDHLSAAS